MQLHVSVTPVCHAKAIKNDVELAGMRCEDAYLQAVAAIHG
jgi:hypothetical protein